MKPCFPRPRQISTAIYLLHLSDLPLAFYLNEGFCLHMAAHVSPDLTTVNTLNKWNRTKAEANRYPLQKEMWYDHFSYLEGLENGRHCETASVICHISFKSVAFVGLKNGERSTPQRAINQALSSMLSCSSSLFGERVCHVSVGADTHFGSISFHSLISYDIMQYIVKTNSTKGL